MPSPGLPRAPWRSLMCCVVCALLSACAWQWHEPAVHAGDWHHEPWRLHCETVESYQPSREPGGRHSGWVWAEAGPDNPWLLDGALEDGFLRVARVRASDPPGKEITAPSHLALRELCRNTLLARPEPALELGKVRAARHGENIDVPIVVPGKRSFQVNRMVIFGDSLSDTGRLKHRLHVFPGWPYWLGRFSDGPAWPDYLEAATPISVQNHAYGGAVTAGNLHPPGEELFARIKQEGQLLVTGSLPLQVDDFLHQRLDDGRLARPEQTVFVIWAGANDYLWKEPITGEISTFLNSPRGAAGYQHVVDEVVSSLSVEIRRLYAAGARLFVLLNLPDLGKTPIVAQNETYLPPWRPRSDTERKLALAERLSLLSDYHNRMLESAAGDLGAALPQARILVHDVAGSIDSILQPSPPPEYGFQLEARWTTLADENNARPFPRRCYEGGYLGSRDPEKVCTGSEEAFFWDVIHPTSYAHCWQGYFLQITLAEAGWLPPVPAVGTYRQWCQRAGRELNRPSWRAAAGWEGSPAITGE